MTRDQYIGHCLTLARAFGGLAASNAIDEVLLFDKECDAA